MRTALVTGLTGFVGSYVARALLDAGWHVVGVKRSTSSLAALGDAASKITFYDADTVDVDVVFEGKVDAVVHVATNMGRRPARDGEALTDAGAGFWPDVDVLRDNVDLPLRLLILAIQHRVPTFLSTDTCVPPWYPAMRPYALSKRQFVDWGRAVAVGTDTRFISLRLCQPYGPRERSAMFVPWVIRECIRSSGEITLTPGGQLRDFVYATDVARAYLTVLDAAPSFLADVTELDCGTGIGTPIRDFAQLVHRMTGSGATLRFGAKPYRDGEFDWVANIAPLRTLGWAPRVSLEDGLRLTLREEYGVDPQ